MSEGYLIFIAYIVGLGMGALGLIIAVNLYDYLRGWKH